MRFSCYHKLEHIAMSITNNQLLKYKNTILRCGLGTTSCAIGWDGKIYGCQQDVSYNIKNIMFIGDLNKNGINKRKHIKLLKQYIYNLSQYPYSKESCQSCILL
jgi:radical SAM protein with 4Fe4S-binding SPASM domain